MTLAESLLRNAREVETDLFGACQRGLSAEIAARSRERRLKENGEAIRRAWPAPGRAAPIPMARLDMYRRPGTGREGYSLDVQAGLLSRLSTRTVVPLLPHGAMPRPVDQANPVFEIGGQRHVLLTQAVASFPSRELKHAPVSLHAEHDSITRVLDLPFIGLRGVQARDGQGSVPIETPPASSSIVSRGGRRGPTVSSAPSAKPVLRRARSAKGRPRRLPRI